MQTSTVCYAPRTARLGHVAASELPGVRWAASRELARELESGSTCFRRRRQCWGVWVTQMPANLPRHATVPTVPPLRASPVHRHTALPIHTSKTILRYYVLNISRHQLRHMRTLVKVLRRGQSCKYEDT
ncbi:hypothetical protein BU16DRAFT_563855 [Lophium mytilinum]|uniref:Uncharacterized protein n=1 Tax=Lophium mytilinum TaxID=390894 RepID=A0A6A6QJU8_9PEZI|nr:hypothetical protein BU16DRAFT_563855 [Lophium mytilinum]